MLALAVRGYILITTVKRNRRLANVPLVEIVIGIRSRNKRVDAASARYRKSRARAKFISDIARVGKNRSLVRCETAERTRGAKWQRRGKAIAAEIVEMVYVNQP